MACCGVGPILPTDLLQDGGISTRPDSALSGAGTRPASATQRPLSGKRPKRPGSAAGSTRPSSATDLVADGWWWMASPPCLTLKKNWPRKQITKDVMPKMTTHNFVDVSLLHSILARTESNVKNSNGSFHQFVAVSKWKMFDYRFVCLPFKARYPLVI